MSVHLFRGELSVQTETGTCVRVDIFVWTGFSLAKCFKTRRNLVENALVNRVSPVMLPPGVILRWQEPVTITGVPLYIWVLLLVSSLVVVFICEPCFFWCNFFFCLLDTLFFQPELDTVFPAYVPA